MTACGVKNKGSCWQNLNILVETTYITRFAENANYSHMDDHDNYFIRKRTRKRKYYTTSDKQQNDGEKDEEEGEEEEDG